MIQPLHASRIQWVLDWVDLDEPVRTEAGFFLPTCLFVLTDATEPLVGQEILRELDQRRAESMLARLFSEQGPPHQIVIPESSDWDVRGWKAFAGDMQCEVRLIRQSERNIPPLLAMTRRVKEDMARRLVEACRKNAGSTRAQEVAEGLVETATRLVSREKRLASLQKALELDPRCSRALLELGDMEYQEGNFRNALEKFEQISLLESGRWKIGEVSWWTNPETRPLLRAMYGQMLVQWQTGRFDLAAEAAAQLIDLNPADNQGLRFFLPMLHLLAEHHEDALAFFEHYESKYLNDYEEPAFLFGWGLACGMVDDEQKALIKYKQGMLRNIYIAPLLLDLAEPRRDLWHPSDRSEPHYAAEFFDSYATLWERDTAQLRLLREAYEQAATEIEQLVDLRLRMAEHQDQRYDPDHQKKWKELLAEEKVILGEPSNNRG